MPSLGNMCTLAALRFQSNASPTNLTMHPTRKDTVVVVTGCCGSGQVCHTGCGREPPHESLADGRKFTEALPPRSRTLSLSLGYKVVRRNYHCRTRCAIGVYPTVHIHASHNYFRAGIGLGKTCLLENKSIITCSGHESVVLATLIDQNPCLRETGHLHLPLSPLVLPFCCGWCMV